MELICAPPPLTHSCALTATGPAVLEWYRRLKKPKDADKEEMKDSKAVRLQAKLGVGPFWTPLYGAPPAPRALTQVCVHVCVFSVCLGLTQYVCVVVLLAL